MRSATAMAVLEIALTSALLFRRFIGNKWFELRQQPKTLSCFGECGAARFGDFVILARRSLLGECNRLFFPFGGDVVGAFESSQGGIDGATGEPGDGHDVEAVAVAIFDCL